MTGLISILAFVSLVFGQVTEEIQIHGAVVREVISNSQVLVSPFNCSKKVVKIVVEEGIKEKLSEGDIVVFFSTDSPCVVKEMKVKSIKSGRDFVKEIKLKRGVR